MENLGRLNDDYPWTQTPLVVGAPMRLIALAKLAVEVSKAGGIGFIGAGTDVSTLSEQLQEAEYLLQSSSLPTSNNTLPIGIGFINWGASLEESVPLIQRYRPAAVWFFAPTSTESLKEWVDSSRKANRETKIWVQIGSVKEAIEALTVEPDALVVQGTDAGGHGLVQGASIVSLLPEVSDAITTGVKDKGGPAPILLAAGGIADSRGLIAALALGASGIVMGTRFLASYEAQIATGYQLEILRASDGGQSTVRTKVYDTLRGTTGWAETHNARGVVNRSFVDAMAGMDLRENKRRYEEETKNGDAGWGTNGRMTTYAGSAVGLVRDVKGAGDIVKEVRERGSMVIDKLRRLVGVA